ncbi:GNAT family N-acetyltransferase [Oculatella sp. LEGE 06141]|uniref:MSMEG_0567/Sll0786 family nitrogen starvation N-acetyltransferase n=1 Tax=Oculatella sp. LEGE 06141 TaxID=1828648 RepID=UPI0018818C73|nr:MSMEG_0567/Sll0786 family nitrogen starvation N-acetyltransferase [Oculatella sp. LEGE 06141]MBE9181270.1 GNAT family N-acetyltransferase [Oculatella sp. LEGE 06141]
MAGDRYSFKLATSAWDVSAYFQLRQAIFCHEQALFAESDEDDIDHHAYPIVAIDNTLTTGNPVVGVVRIYETEPGLWYGGRLGVHQDYRRAGRIGKGLIYKAVTTANTWGCRQFLATVQLQNVRFFQRQHWRSLEEILICDRPHHLMEADLNFYPPGHEGRPVLSTLVGEASAC